MQRRKTDVDIKDTADRIQDTADKLITFSHRTLYLVLWTVILTVFAATAGYFSLAATAHDALALGKKNEATISPMACNVRQLTNYMIYGIKPRDSDRCDDGRR